MISEDNMCQWSDNAVIQQYTKTTEIRVSQHITLNNNTKGVTHGAGTDYPSAVNSRYLPGVVLLDL
jgi:hypothetical protein